MNFQNKLVLNGFLLFCLTFNSFSEGGGGSSEEESESDIQTTGESSSKSNKGTEKKGRLNKSTKFKGFRVPRNENFLYDGSSKSQYRNSKKNQDSTSYGEESGSKFFLGSDDEETIDHGTYSSQNHVEQKIIAQLEDLNVRSIKSDDESDNYRKSPRIRNSEAKSDDESNVETSYSHSEKFQDNDYLYGEIDYNRVPPDFSNYKEYLPETGAGGFYYLR